MSRTPMSWPMCAVAFPPVPPRDRAEHVFRDAVALVERAEAADYRLFVTRDGQIRAKLVSKHSGQKRTQQTETFHNTISALESSAEHHRCAVAYLTQTRGR